MLLYSVKTDFNKIHDFNGRTYISIEVSKTFCKNFLHIGNKYIFNVVHNKNLHIGLLPCVHIETNKQFEMSNFSQKVIPSCHHTILFKCFSLFSKTIFLQKSMCFLDVKDSNVTQDLMEINFEFGHLDISCHLQAHFFKEYKDILISVTLLLITLKHRVNLLLTKKSCPSRTCPKMVYNINSKTNSPNVFSTKKVEEFLAVRTHNWNGYSFHS